MSIPSLTWQPLDRDTIALLFDRETFELFGPLADAEGVMIQTYIIRVLKDLLKSSSAPIAED